MKDRLSALLTVKSLVTVTLTGVFAALALQRCVSAQEFLTVFTVVMQHENLSRCRPWDRPESKPRTVRLL